MHCAVCGGEFPGTTELHNGICDACQKLTHGSNYRLVAQINAHAEVVKRLRLEIDRAERERLWSRQRIGVLEAEIERLRYEAERLREKQAAEVKAIREGRDDE